METRRLKPARGLQDAFTRLRRFLHTLSGDGQRVVFKSVSANIVTGDTNGAQDVFLRDRASAETTRISFDSVGSQLMEDSFVPCMTDDARVLCPGGGLRTIFCLSNPNSTGAR